MSTRAISSESDTSGLGAFVYYVLCPGAIKEPVDMGAGMDYLIRLYTNIVKLCLKNKDSKQLNFCEREANFFSKSDYGLKHETQSHSQEDFDTRFPLRLGRMGLRRNPIPAVELVDITRTDINNESLIYREPTSIN